MADLISMLAAAGGAGGEVDPNFNQTVLLLHGDGTNGAQNNTFLDSSTNNFTITRNPATGPNAPTQGTFSPFSAPDGRWSNYFDGDGDWVEFGSSADFAVGSVVTIECWFYPLAQAGALMMGTVGTAAPQLGWQNSTTFGVASVGVAWRLTSATVPTLNAWNHVAFVRTGTGTNEASIFLNGTRIANGTVSDAWTSNTGFTVGAASDDSAEFTGYISNARVVKGTAVYSPSSTTITVPTSPFSTSTTNQKLLTCYSNRFVDANTATTAKAITVNGNPKVTPFSPFAPTAAYSPSVNGGSGYFDGTGDYLTLPTSQQILPATGDFTIQLWFYPTSLTSNALLYTQTNGGASLGRVNVYANSNGSLGFQVGNTTGTGTTGVILANQWNYIAITRTGSSVAFYANGATAGTATVSGTIDTGSSITAINRGADGTASPVPGYISNFRISDTIRTGLTSTPTTLLVDDANTSLLLNFTNAGIFDNTGKNNLETVGNAQIDTTTKKYGTGSMEFDGTGDYLVTSDYLDYNFGAGNFTIEMWVNFSASVSGSGYYLLARGPAAFDVNSGWTLWRSTSNTLRFIFSTDGTVNNYYYTDIAFTPTTGVWYHIAVTRDGSTFKMFIDGDSKTITTGSAGTGSASSAIFNSTRPLHIGASSDAQAGTQFNGFIDDLRITKGVARYTSNFTAPTKAFPDL